MILNFENSSFWSIQLKFAFKSFTLIFFSLMSRGHYVPSGSNAKDVITNIWAKKRCWIVDSETKKLNKYSGRFNFFFVNSFFIWCSGFTASCPPSTILFPGKIEKCKCKTIVNEMNGFVLNLEIQPHFNGKWCRIGPEKKWQYILISFWILLF